MTFPKNVSWSQRMRTKSGGGVHASAWSCRRAIASPSRRRWTGRADSSWMRPSIQRSTEQTRVSPAADASTVGAPSRAASASGTSRSVSARMARSQAISERMAAVESTSRPCRCLRCTRTRCRPAALSCRNVVFSPWSTNVSRPLGSGKRSSAATATWRSRATCARRDGIPPPWPGRARGATARATSSVGEQGRSTPVRPAYDPAMASPERRRPPTMADVAAHAGVSHQTVSRVLNGVPGVRPGTALRVHESISELGYRRNMAAKMLASSRSRTIGVPTRARASSGPRRCCWASRRRPVRPTTG